MEETTNNPIEELKQVSKAIKQYEVVLKTTKDPTQKKRVRRELARLKDYRDKFEHVYSLSADEGDENVQGEFAGYPFLSRHLTFEYNGNIHDREVNAILSILHFFEREFLPILTGNKTKLDFKYSLERDGFYHLFQELMKRIEDFEDEVKIINDGKYKESTLTEIKNRRLWKRRVLIIETDKIFRRCRHFTQEILKDIEKSGVACLNPDTVIHFEELEGVRFLEGVCVQEALSLLDTFAGEVLDFFNLPEIVVQE